MKVLLTNLRRRKSRSIRLFAKQWSAVAKVEVSAISPLSAVRLSEPDDLRALR